MLKSTSAIVLVFLFVFSVFVNYSNAQALDPVTQVKSIAVSNDGGSIFILNGNDTISVYNLNEKRFEIIQYSPPLLDRRTSNILLSPSGDHLVSIFREHPTSIFFNLYRTEDILASRTEKEPYRFSILKDRSRRGRVLSVFSQDSEKFYIANTTNGGISVLDITKNVRERIIKVGGIIVSIEIDDSDKFLFILTRNPNNLHILDTATNSIIGTFKVGSVPSNILYNDVLDRVFVSNMGSDTVSIIDIKSRQVNHVSVSSQPISLAYSRRTGDVFVANNGVGTLSVISPDFTVEEYDIGSSAYARSSPILLSYSDEAQKLFIVNGSTRKLLVLDSENFQIIKEEKISGKIRNLQKSNDQSFIVIDRYDSNNILVVDPITLDEDYYPSLSASSEQITQSFFSSPQSIVIDIEGKRIFVSNLGSGDVTVIDSETLKLITKIPTGLTPQVLAYNPKTKKLYISDPSEDSVTIIDTSMNDYPAKILSLPGMPRTIRVNSLANEIYVSLSDAGSLGVIDGENDSLITIIELGSEIVFPLLNSIDEKRNKIYVADYGGDSVVMIDGVTHTVEKNILVGKNPMWVLYSQTLDQVYVTVEGEQKVVVINPENGAIVDSIYINGTPYRVIIDDRTGFIYIIHRKESIVTVLKKTTNGAEVFTETSIKYLGELDTVYNLISKDENSNTLYITFGSGNRVFIAEMYLDSSDILRPRVHTVIRKDGEILNLTSRTVVEDGWLTQVNVYILYIFIVGFITFLIGVAYFLRRKRSEPTV